MKEVTAQVVMLIVYPFTSPQKMIVMRKKLEKKIETFIAGAINPLLTTLLPRACIYRHSVRVNMGMTNRKGVVSHEQYARIFGIARELFGLDRIPGFAREAGKEYLLKTCEAQYRYFKDFYFGDTILAQVNVSEVNGASFRLQCKFINKKTGKLHAISEHLVAYADMNGKPRRMPFWLNCLTKLIFMKTQDNFIQNLPRHNGQPIFRTELLVTSDMTNVEKNVSHDQFPKIVSRAIEEYALSANNYDPAGIEALDVVESGFTYHRDFYFGDKMVVNLSAEYQPGKVVYWARLENENGELRSYGKQSVKL